MLRPTLAGLAALLSPTAASATWHQASSAHFTIYSDESPATLEAFATKLERFDKAVRERQGLSDPPLTPGNKLNVYVVPNTYTVEKLAGIGNVAGFYVPRASGSVAFVPRRVDNDGRFDLSAQAIFFHEYTHHIMLANYRGLYPEWLVEGFAEFFATAHVENDGSVGFGYPPNYRAYGLTANEAKLPIEKLLAGSYTKLTEAQRDHVYGRGWLIVHYLTFETKRAGQLTTYLGALENGKGGLEAARSAFGDLKVFDRELDAYLKQRRLLMISLPATRLPIGPIDVRPLTPGQAAFMKVRVRSTSGVDEKKAVALVVEARKIAAPYPQDPIVQAQLAEVEHDAGNWDQADAAADRALTADGKNIDAMIYKGRIAVARAAAVKATDPAVWREARAWFVKASRVDNEDPEPKVLYFASFEAAGIVPTRNAVDALLYAMELVPQDAALRLLVAHQYLVDGKAAEARAVLAPVAYNPHGDAGRVWAAKIMAKLVAGDAKGALADWDERPKENEKRGAEAGATDSLPGLLG